MVESNGAVWGGGADLERGHGGLLQGSDISAET